MRFLILLLTLYFLPPFPCAPAQDSYHTLRDLPYRPDTLGEYARERCVLDLYYPTDSSGFATIVFFHGGGLSGGGKYLPEGWRERGVAVVAPNYRLHPKVKNPTYTRDAAAAVAWVMDHIKDYGGDPGRIYVTGHSAGGYLTSMVALDTTLLQTHGKHPDSLAGFVPFSGHTMSHFTVRRERGLGWRDSRIDAYSPVWHLRERTPPILLTTGDRELELYGRYEETAYFWRMMRLVGNEDVHLFEFEGFGHGQMVGPSVDLTLNFIRGRLRLRE